MGRIVRACAGILAVITAMLAMLAGTATAAAGPCEQKVLLDWSDNGRVDGMYPLRCYDGALTSMPSDLRDYTNASDAIQRALARATTRNASAGDEPSRVAAGTGMQLGGPGPSEVPLPLIVLAGVSLLVLAAGSLGWIARRRRGRSIA
jgi:hypothetical protein